MARAGKPAAQVGGTQIPVTGRDLPVAPGSRREPLTSKSVVEGLRKRVMHIGGVDWKSDREIEREKEEKMEKARAAAWAWYQHGKGGKESLSSTGLVGTVSTLSVRAGGSSGSSAHKSSRFKTEALKSSGEASSSQSTIAEELSDPGWQIVTPPSASQPRYHFQHPHSSSNASSLFDSYELDSVSRRIDFAFKGEILPVPESVHVRSHSQNIPRGLPVPVRPPGASSTKKGAIVGSKRGSSAPAVNKSRSFRLQFPSSLCRSISDVINREDMAVGIDIGKCDCHEARLTQRIESGAGWSLRKISKAFQAFMHLPECEYHPQQEHHERRLARLQHGGDHENDEDYHSHLHYKIKLRDGVHHGNPVTARPGKSGGGEGMTKGKDHLSFRRLSPKMSPKVSPKSF